MSEAKDAPWRDPDVWAERDRRSGIRHLRHLAKAAIYEVPSERQAALQYLRLHEGARAYGVTLDQLAYLEASIDEGQPAPDRSEDRQDWLRWRPTRFLPATEGGAPAAATVVMERVRFRMTRDGWEAVQIPGQGLRVLMRGRSAPGRPPGEVERWDVTASSGPAPPPELIIDEAELRLLAELGLDERVQVLTDLVARTAALEELGRMRATAEVRPVMTEVAGRQPAGHGARQMRMRLAYEVAMMASPRDMRRLTMWLPQEAAPRPTQGRDATVGYRAVVERDGDLLKVASIRAQVASCTGAAYPRDPPSRWGNIAIRPSLRAAQLDGLREEVPLRRLVPGNPQALSGALVAIAENPLGIPSPQDDFDASVRKDDFAAISAYHSCDCMFALARSFGFDTTNLFWPHCQVDPPAEGASTRSQFPVPVQHRAAMTIPSPETGSPPFTDAQVFTINAQVVGGAGQVDVTSAGRVAAVSLSTFVQEMRFALGDLSDWPITPLPGATDAFGVAADARWAWHEFGHALIVAGTGRLELPFAHSIGDALAAIMSDPDSELAHPRHGALRGVTFPFVAQPLRRHDRDPALGWGWHGTLNPPRYPDPTDPDGYAAEEILSSTLFRLYCALGGDAMLGLEEGLDEPDRPRRRAAAAYVVYLLMRAVGSLGAADAAPATPGILASALMGADAETGLFDHAGRRRRGGAIGKVIRWAFERQGLYQPPGARWPQNRPGVPEPVDVFVEDGRGGAYHHVPSWQTPASVLSLRPTTVSAGDAAPVLGVAHHLTLQVGNRGTEPAEDVIVTAFAALGNACDTWERDNGTWTPMQPLGAGHAGPFTIMPGETVTTGPFLWTPAQGGRQAVLLAVDALGDRSVLYQPSNLACGDGPIGIADLVPFDNNLAYRHWVI